MKFILSICLVFCGVLSFSSARDKQNKKRLPVWITYANNKAADSIQDFVKVYLQLKGYQTIEKKEVFDAIPQAFLSEMDKLLASNTITTANIERVKKEAASTPVCNVFWIKLCEGNESGILNIDSVQWKTNIIPAIDSGSVLHTSYIDKKKNIFENFKVMVDEVVNSGLLDKTSY
jgi:hypothetical protein